MGPEEVGPQQLRDGFMEYVRTLSDWRSFVTLTFKDCRTEDVSRRYFRRLVQVLNVDAFGKRYYSKVGHSYFGYVLALEYQRRDCPHFHFVADRPLNYDLVHAWWGRAAGFAWIEKVESVEAVSGYVTKYLLKGGNVDLWLPGVHKSPIVNTGQNPFLPWWWERNS